MSVPASPPGSLYQQLVELPEMLVGEIIGGRLYTQPRPAAPHALAASSLGADVHSAYHRGRGGPGGWWILNEPELHFVRDAEVAVPDIAGWRREHMPQLPRDQRFEVAPDWICEVLSPTTAKHDRVVKMPLYARYGVGYLWLIDPLARTLEAYALQDQRWMVIDQFKDQDQVTNKPVSALVNTLSDLWIEIKD